MLYEHAYVPFRIGIKVCVVRHLCGGLKREGLIMPFDLIWKRSDCALLIDLEKVWLCPFYWFRFTLEIGLIWNWKSLWILDLKITLDLIRFGNMVWFWLGNQFRFTFEIVFNLILKSDSVRKSGLNLILKFDSVLLFENSNLNLNLNQRDSSIIWCMRVIGLGFIPSVSWPWLEEVVGPFGIGAPLLAKIRQSNGVVGLVGAIRAELRLG